jgi:Zn-dependent metalloprotease
MVSGRLRCLCCALPVRVLEHVASQAGEAHGARIAGHQRTSDRIRAGRRSRAEEPAAAAPSAARRRLVYDAGGTEQLPGRLVRKEGAAAVKDSAVNQVYDNVGITLDFFAKVFGRDSLDGKGMNIDAIVHYGERFANAMWTGREMLFGDGDGIHILGFTHSLDIVAHELTHAVTQHAIPGGLGQRRRGKKVELVGQAGALNESISDVFASMVKQWHAKQDVTQADWLLGEGILSPDMGRAVRSLKEPGRRARTYDGDDQVGDMTAYVEGGDVHANSGIPNHAFYLAAHALGGHSWERAGRAWYEAMALLKPRSTFRDAAHATIESAGRLFGGASKEQHAVQAAWEKVKLLEG